MLSDYFTATAAWRAAYPGAAAGVLVMRGLANPPEHPALEQRKLALERELRERYRHFDRDGLLALPALEAYAAYYKRFKKTYHVQLQLESLVFKGKPLPRRAALVEAVFMAELQDLLLTAVHDLDAVVLPAALDVAQGGEVYTTLRGDPETLKPGDMFIADGRGVISSIIYGPDQRTQIRPHTTQALFTAYAPPGLAPAAVAQHLQTLQDNLRLIAPAAEVVAAGVITA